MRFDTPEKKRNLKIVGVIIIIWLVIIGIITSISLEIWGEEERFDIIRYKKYEYSYPPYVKYYFKYSGEIDIRVYDSSNNLICEEGFSTIWKNAGEITIYVNEYDDYYNMYVYDSNTLDLLHEEYFEVYY
jgi:hypothetical protein